MHFFSKQISISALLDAFFVLYNLCAGHAVYHRLSQRDKIRDRSFGSLTTKIFIPDLLAQQRLIRHIPPHISAPAATIHQNSEGRSSERIITSPSIIASRPQKPFPLKLTKTAPCAYRLTDIIRGRRLNRLYSLIFPRIYAGRTSHRGVCMSGIGFDLSCPPKPPA